MKINQTSFLTLEASICENSIFVSDVLQEDLCESHQMHET